MKTNRSGNICKLSTVAILAVAILAVLVTRPAFGQVQGHTISITESSSTSLTVIYDGMNITATGVMNTSADHWTVTTPDSLVYQTFMIQAPGIGTGGQWKEPEFIAPSNPLVNFVFVTTASATNQFFVASDQMGLSTVGLVENGSTNDVGADGQNQLPGQFINMTVTDNGDGASGVPESGSTLSLLVLSSMALLGTSRLLFRRTA